MSKPIPKSLHTVTVLVRVAENLPVIGYWTPEEAVSEALKLLGYDPTNDPHSLAAAAAKQLEKMD